MPLFTSLSMIANPKYVNFPTFSIPLSKVIILKDDLYEMNIDFDLFIFILLFS